MSTKFAAVIFEACDLHSAVQRTIESIPLVPGSNWTLFVEQSIHGKFVAKFREQWSRLAVSGGDVRINYEAIDVEKLLDQLNIPLVNVVQFRTNSELLSLSNHFPSFNAMSIWTSNITLGLELCKKMTSCFYFWLNSVLEFHSSVESFTLMEPTILNAYCKLKKWNAKSETQRLEILRQLNSSYLKDDEHVELCPSATKSEELEAIEVADNYLVIQRKKLIDFISVLTSSSATCNEIAHSLLHGRCVFLITTAVSNETKSYIEKLKEQSELKFLIITEKDDGFESIMEDLTDGLGSSMGDLTTQVIWIPSGGVVSFAK
ncbi:hypothetical protein HDE_08722 [Halotydeus destructor]|nr:hypothetical protein HDE_08722 [Halotydeus destructor]